MKREMILAAAIAIVLTGCSYINNDRIADGNYSCQVQLTGGSGRASVTSPAQVSVTGDDKYVELIWSSSNYDYMIVDDVRYDNEAEVDENSVFTIPFEEFDEPFTVIGDTTAMSTPHEIEYELTVSAPGEDAPIADSASDADLEGISEEYDLGNLTYDSSLELTYAKEYSVDYYKDDLGNTYAFITVGDSLQYFLKGMGCSTKDLEGISDNVVLLDDIDNTYLVSTSVMDLIVGIDALDYIKFSGTKEDDWYIDEAASAMEQSLIEYAGKYSAPDYELLLTDGCNFAIENTMIYHNPEVKEKLEELNIPVMVERSSYESNPLGRLEWIKLYGVLYGKSDEALELFKAQEDRVSSIQNLEKTGKSVAFFSINSNGQITIRKPGDYISTMIEMAGGEYIIDTPAPEDNALSTMKITAEDFYVDAVGADLLIYNSTIEGEVSSVQDLVKEMPSLADFKAVKNGNIYCLKEDYFQKSTNVAEFIEEMHILLQQEDGSLEYFYKLRE